MAIQRAYNFMKGFARGFSQDWAEAKVMRDILRSEWKGKKGFARKADDLAAMADMYFLPRNASGDINVMSSLRRIGTAGALGIYGAATVSDLADRAFNPRRGFMMDRSGTRVDLPIIPFI